MSMIRVLHDSPPFDEPTYKPPQLDGSNKTSMWEACSSQWRANRPSCPARGGRSTPYDRWA
jgi:hypothetical protein